jgi:hypothetical protein
MRTAAASIAGTVLAFRIGAVVMAARAAAVAPELEADLPAAA